jgi:hypothetical protein
MVYKSVLKPPLNEMPLSGKFMGSTNFSFQKTSASSNPLYNMKNEEPKINPSILTPL